MLKVKKGKDKAKEKRKRPKKTDLSRGITYQQPQGEDY